MFQRCRPSRRRTRLRLSLRGPHQPSRYRHAHSQHTRQRQQRLATYVQFAHGLPGQNARNPLLQFRSRHP